MYIYIKIFKIFAFLYYRLIVSVRFRFPSSSYFFVRSYFSFYYILLVIFWLFARSNSSHAAF